MPSVSSLKIIKLLLPLECMIVYGGIHLTNTSQSELLHVVVLHSIWNVVAQEVFLTIANGQLWSAAEPLEEPLLLSARLRHIWICRVYI